MPKAAGIGVEEDALDPAFGHSQQDGRKGLALNVKDQRRLAVENPPHHLQLRAIGGRFHEGSHTSCAVERPPEIADPRDFTAFWSAVGDQDGVGREQARERRDVARGSGRQKGLQEPLMLLA